MNQSENLRKALPIVAMGLAAVGIYCLVEAPRVRQQAADLPRLTATELIQNGPGPHRVIALTDISLSGRGSVGERDSDTGQLELYHPLYPSPLRPEPDPKTFRVLLVITDEMARRRIRDARGPQLELGEVIGEVKKAAPPAWAIPGLAAKYPGLPIADCWQLTIGEYEPTAGRADRLTWYGIGATAAALILGFGWWMWRRGSLR